MKLSVPYYSQFVDIQDPFWMLRACGATSLKMVAEFNGKDVPDILTLCNEAKDHGGYDMRNGWIHDYLVTKAQELGLQAERKEGLTTFNEIKASLDVGCPVIVSVEKRVLEQTRFHMLVVVGYEQIADERGINVEGRGKDSGTDTGELSTTYNPQPATYIYYHEPESTDKEKGQYRMCTEEVFMEYFRGKAIFIKK